MGIDGKRGLKMKKFREQFNNTKAYRERFMDNAEKDRFEKVYSWVTCIAIVDNKTRRVYKGRYADGCSRSTTRQFHDMLWQWYKGYKVFDSSTRQYKLFMTKYNIDSDWDKFGGWF